MITDVQIQFLAQIYQEVHDILNGIPDFDPNYNYNKVDSDYIRGLENYGEEFFYDEEEGLYELVYLDRGDTCQDFYGKTKKEIIQHIAEKRVNDEAFNSYIYKAKRFELRKGFSFPAFNTLSSKQIQDTGQERIDYCLNIVKDCLSTIEDAVFPQNPENEPESIIKQGKFLTLVSKDDRILMKVHFPNVEDFNDYTLAVQPEESGLFVFYHIYKRKSTYDITRFFDRTKILSLKSGNAIIERLDIDKEDGAVSDIINKI